MTSDELRGAAASLREIASDQSATHAAQARLLAGTLSPADQIAVKALASVADCMARRHRQWATLLELAAGDIDELPDHG